MGRGGSSSRWLERQSGDPYVKRRQQQGYRSRAAYKLAEINQREGLIRPRSRVLDLGAAPGGWTQVAAAIAGSQGTVVALDVLKMDPVAGATLITGDCREASVREQVDVALGGQPLDLVMSDMAPNISGIAVQDEAAMEELALIAFDVADAHLREGGSMLIKLFQFAGTDALMAEIKQRFRQVARRKPDASRARSREFYVVAKRFGL